MEKIIIANQDDFNSKKAKFIQGGAPNLHILSDFDRTLTRAFVNEKKINTDMAQLRTGGFLSPEYSKRAHELFNKYHPIEIDSNIPFEEKKPKMEEWWRTHFDFLIEVGLTLDVIKEVVDSIPVRFREKTFELLDLLKEKQVPLIIVSSSGLGDAIPLYFEKAGKLYDNIHLIANFFKFDEKKRVIGLKGPIIHVLNKDETSLLEFPFYEEVKKRKNVVLIGDSLGDVRMLKGSNAENVIKIGFLNENVRANLEDYKKAFDVVITGDGSLGFVFDLVKEIVG